MAHQKLKYSKNEVNRAGQILADFENADPYKYINALEVMNNWRSCHSYPINTFQATLRQKLTRIDSKALVAQRLKRAESIISKLRRFRNMQLSRMQDIGGLRAVVRNLKQARELHESYREGRLEHKLILERDYIQQPKESGYRSIHLVYRYKKNSYPHYDGFQVEIQIRTKLQHAWATAVETMGTFLETALKSSEGPSEWLSFFSLAGSAFARLEKCNPVPGFEELDELETYKRMLVQFRKLQIDEKLSAFSIAARAISSDNRKGNYYLLMLDVKKKEIMYRIYTKGRLEIATSEYLKEEEKSRNEDGYQVVLVAADSVDALRKAYPNYFLDTHEFLRSISTIEKKCQQSVVADV